MGLPGAGMFQNYPATQVGGGIGDGASPHVAFRFEQSLQSALTAASTAERRLFCESSSQPRDGAEAEDKHDLLLETTATTGVGWTVQQPSGGITVVPRQSTVDNCEEPELKPTPCIAIGIFLRCSLLVRCKLYVLVLVHTRTCRVFVYDAQKIFNLMLKE